MIVRISGEGQYRVDDTLHARLNELDDAVVAAVDSGDAAAYQASFEQLLAFVRGEGRRLGEEELEASDVILPPPDLSFEEAGVEFTGEGLIPEPA
ncbi:MAG: PspA-associated protein PspAA [Solirubrobacteraceae bacterium]